MYPTLGPNSSNPAPNPYANVHAYPQQQPPAAHPHPGINAAQNLSPSASQSFSTLRVKVDDQYRVPPPVEIPGNLDNAGSVTASQFSFDFQYEKDLVEEGTAEAIENGDASNPAEVNVAVVDPWGDKLEGYRQLGYTADEIGMGFAACGLEKENEFKEFVQDYRRLKGMGFPPAIVTGALIKHKGNLHAASETCLMISQNDA